MKHKAEATNTRSKSMSLQQNTGHQPISSALRASLIIIMVLASIYILVFIATPFFALRYLEHWYAQQGEGYSLLVDGWTLSPFTGEIELHDVVASYSTSDDTTDAEVGAEFIGINVNLSALFERTIHVQSVGISGLQFRGAQSEQGLSIAGITLPEAAADPEAAELETEAEANEVSDISETAESSSVLPEGWSLRVDDISLTDDLISWKQSGLSLTVRLDELSTGLFNSATETATPISLDVTLEELMVDLASDSDSGSGAQAETDSVNNRLVLRSPVTLTLQAEASSLLTDVKVAGDISLSALALEVPGIEGVEFSALDIKGVSFSVADGNMQAGVDSLTLKNVLALLPEDEKAQFDQFNLSSMRWRANEDDVAIKGVGLEGFNGNLAGFPSISLAQFKSADLRVTNLSSVPNAEISDASLSTLRAQHPEVGVLQLGDLALSGIQANADAQKVSSLALNALSVTPAEEELPLVSLAHYVITDIEASPTSFTSGVHQFYGLVSNVTRLADGNIKGVPASEVASPDDANSDEASAKESRAPSDGASASESGNNFVVKIAGIQLLTEGDDIPETRFNWTDQTVIPTVNTQGKILELTTGNIDSSNLEQGVDLNLVIALDTYNRIRATGKMGLKGEYPEGSIDVDVQQLNLVDFNPYLVQAMGYRLKKGMLGVDSTISITEGQLGGNVLIKLQNSKFEPADEETINRLSKQIAMPVETALSVLKDDNNNIRIDVPLSGDITQPDVGINDVVNQISRKALRTATLYYLKQSLVPYGQLISIASFAGDQLFAIRLNDLKYDDQQIELTDEHKAYLDTVADMMAKKVELELQACPVASEAEAQAWGDMWYSEAAKRGAAVKAYLAERRDKNDNTLSGRITVCAPKKGDEATVILGV